MSNANNSPAPLAISTVTVALLDLATELRARHCGSGRNKPDGNGVLPAEDIAAGEVKASREVMALFTTRDNEPDRMELRSLATSLYWSLMCDPHPTVRVVSELVGWENPRDVLFARIAIRRLCERGVLKFRCGQEKRWNGTLVLTVKALSVLGLCTKHSPIFGEDSIGMPRANPEANGDAAKFVQPSPATVRIPTAFAMATEIRGKVKGAYLQTPIQTISAMYVTHLHRAALIRGGQHPGTPNVIGLLIGSSSVGKTFLAETAAMAVNNLCGDDSVPFSSFSATDLTQEGYVGCSVEDIFKPLLDRFNWDAAKVRFSCCFIDEIDKKACHVGYGTVDVGGRGVQEALLRIVAGTVVPVGGRRTSWEQKAAQFNSDGTMFLMGGAFVGLDELKKRPSGSRIGYGGDDGARGLGRLRDCLVEYGLIPELVSRIGSIIVCADPQLPDLVEICTAPGGLVACYRRLWRGMGMTVSLSADTVAAIAGYGIETRSFARGMQAVLNRMTERLVFEARNGNVRLGVGNVRAAMESMCGGNP
jgi:hypothetical protein